MSAGVSDLLTRGHLMDSSLAPRTQRDTAAQEWLTRRGAAKPARAQIGQFWANKSDCRSAVRNSS